MGALDMAVHAATMTSREMAELTEKRHDSVKRTIDTLVLGGLISQPQIVDGAKSGNGVIEEVYLVGKRDSYVVVAQLSPEFTARIVDRWQALEDRAVVADPLAGLPAEQRAMVAIMLDNAAIKQVQAQQGASILAIEHRVNEAAESHLLLARPANAENMGMIRARISKKHGLSASIIDQVMRQSLYAPKPAGMVKNSHENAQGGSYAVYWTKDVTALFVRFTAECAPTTATQYTHPLIDGKFKMVAA